MASSVVTVMTVHIRACNHSSNEFQYNWEEHISNLESPSDYLPRAINMKQVDFYKAAKSIREKKKP
jgi:hypothetical protein